MDVTGKSDASGAMGDTATAPKAATASSTAEAPIMRALRVVVSCVYKREPVILCIGFMQSVKICP